MKRVGLVLMVGLMVACGDTREPAAEPDVPEKPSNEEMPGPSDPLSDDLIWKDVRYPGCPESVDPEECERVITFARVDYMIPNEAAEWEAVPGEYRLEYEIRREDGELLLEGALSVWRGSLRGTGWWSGGIFSLAVVPVEDGQWPEARCDFRVSEDDVIRDANEPEPGVIFCVNEAGTAAVRFEYDRCSTWGPFSEQSTCPTAEDDKPEIPEVDLNECQAGVCSCTDAGIRAAAAHEDGTFVFACDGPTTVVTVAEVVVEHDVTLDGQNRLTVDGGGDHPVFRVLRRANATVRRMKISGGWGGNPGTRGGVFNEGGLVLEEVEISDNLSSGIINEGSNATLVLRDSVVERNAGRGVLNYSGSSTTIGSSKIRDNGDSGVSNGGTLAVSETVLSGNYSGLDIWGGEATVVRSTVSHNTATDGVGGGITMCNGVLRVSNSTVSGNSATMEGGGILVRCFQNSVTIVNTTVADNVAATGANGISWLGDADLTLRNSVVVGTCGGEVISGGGNIESPGDTCGFVADGDQVGVDAGALGLLALDNYGGPTPTHALAEGSVAVDIVPADECLGVDGELLTTDQRGFARDLMCDAGAFELQP